MMTINELKELTSLQIQYLEYNFPILNYIIVFALLAEVLRQLVEEQRSLLKLFGISVH